MRPLPGDDAFRGCPRTSTTAGDSDTPAFLNLPSAPQMTYFFADEASIGDSSTSWPQAPFHHHRSKDNRRFPSSSSSSPDHPDHYSRHIPKQHESQQQPHSSPFQYEDHRDGSGGTGPRLISSGSKGKAPAGAVDNINYKTNDTASDDLATPMPVASNNYPKLSSAPPPPPLSTTSNSCPTTPFLSAGPASTLGSISSRRNSLSLSSAPSVDGTEYDEQLDNDEEDDQLQETEMMDRSGSAPQLIMPSIRMPSRRPFTEEGRQMGRLKVLIAGDSGVGKTSLIKAVVQSCESVVHVDPIVTGERAGVARSLPVGGRRGKGKDSGETREITEVWASTKPYPAWWSELAGGEGMGGMGKKSLGDEVLDRNVCFVDTMGYGFGSSSMDTITPVTEYIQFHLQRISTNSLSDGDVLNMLGGEGGVQVDVVFYMVSNRLRPVDIHYLRQLSPLTNIIILLAQTDLMSADQVAASKEQIYSQLKEANIRLFSFNTTSSGLEKQGLYAISSANGSDHDNMDASLLMSPDYVQPLFPTELATLVDQVFNKDGISRLRHAAAIKYVQWRRGQPPSPPSPSRRSVSSFSQHSTGESRILNPLGSPPSYALARITDHTQREERLAQVRFANWAADLQKSIASERAQYLALARGDRALWLTERLNECIQEGSLVPVNSRQHTQRHRGRSGSDGLESQRRNVRSSPHYSRQQVRQLHRENMRKHQHENKFAQQNSNHDPLGLLEVAADLRRKGLVVLEVLGSIGVLGGLAVWVVDRWVHVQAWGWVWGELERCWYGR
ncbi:hypothetical protein QBC36DRAFT_375445 [Triangularia setosa]|uniref:Septin-type G domain-containing protein n=1 Tax=Triangularia setosa TaxID=2587417 RepID=A0AAN7AAF9_9PEZI|nr:hypothetical protein QBC36DRAFT_375445 [Podospora setosa]